MHHHDPAEDAWHKLAVATFNICRRHDDTHPRQPMPAVPAVDDALQDLLPFNWPTKNKPGTPDPPY